jgi:cytochrome c oxidase cbb3-type subunit 3/ubiquinol-cytochrome c reductase cytochrome c subunit
MTFKTFKVCSTALSLAMAFALAGCDHAPGRPGPGPEVIRPEQQLDFATLYKTNCVACHGTSGSHGPAISLANPVYLAIAGEDKIQDVTARGVHGTLMPAFAKGSGGTLTDQQVQVLAHGIMQTWGKPNLLAGQNPPPYQGTLTGDTARGQQAFAGSCASCHGANGAGTQKGKEKIGSLVDPSYLALVSDQDIRSFILAGAPDEGMPDWRSDSATPLTDQQITDIVAWMASLRSPNAGQPYPTHP